MLDDKDYLKAIKSVPIICVDVVPVRFIDDKPQIGIITRQTGPFAGSAAVVGGRVRKDETITEAIARHLRHDLEIEFFEFFRSNEATPFYVQQYFEEVESGSSYGHDPAKHDIALNYLIEIQDDPKPKNEASDFYWINESEVPKSGYRQEIIMKAAFKHLHNQATQPSRS
ncbi:MAG TPA: DUF4916 domain-containing protein [Candidatus Dormibacteraeota bacterium]|nr:DUF4916 domain-containing protein [Candidatus Dormibacteraeota bacterium]